MCCYTKNRLPVKLVFMESFHSKYKALVAERKIKKWTRRKKEALIESGWSSLSGICKRLKNKKKKTD